MTSAGGIILTQVTDSGTYIVDLSTGHNCSVRRMVNNPVFTFNMPKDGAEDPDTQTDGNTIIINLNMLTDRFVLNFDLTDGVGMGSMYRMLYMMATNRKRIDFQWGEIHYQYVLIEQLDMGTAPGEDMMLRGCSMTLIFGNPTSWVWQEGT